MTSTITPITNEAPYNSVTWEYRTVHLENPQTKEVILHQEEVEVPSFWSQNATNILASKYFRGQVGTPERERSLVQVIERVVNSITDWGLDDGYFLTIEDAQIFAHDLKLSLIQQESSFNSPVWFNIGVKGVPQQASACFILDIDDTMDSILNWYREEGVIFKGGSGAGVNLSKLRSSLEHLNGGGTASGPVSFMRGADASAGTIKSGGKTRRAAKMVVLNVDHPDIEEFIDTKAHEERKAQALAAAGFDMGLNGRDVISLQYQNANNSVRVTDEFMKAVEEDGQWELKAVSTGETLKTLPARELWMKIAKAAWECADPGLQFDTTINRWNTVADTARIDASNPCSEYMHISNSACNLASLNLLKFYSPERGFDIERFVKTAQLYIIAQDILVGHADYPTEAIGVNARRYRELGIGYANLGALLIAMGLPYDSVAGRNVAASITSLLSAASYKQSVLLAEHIGPCEGYGPNQNSMQHVLKLHQKASTRLLTALASDVAGVRAIAEAGHQYWNEVVSGCEQSGIRNTQISLLAPTGTIGFLMDCDTTGIEPAFSLVSYKEFVGGHAAMLTIGAVDQGLRTLGYDETTRSGILDYIAEHGSVIDAPGLRETDYPVFATAMGDQALSPGGHLKMMGAVQPFLSGAISKTVNLPADTTVADVAATYLEAWNLGLKAVAIYRDGCKLGQPLSTTETRQTEEIALESLQASIDELKAENRQLRSELNTVLTQSRNAKNGTSKTRLPQRRNSVTHSVEIGDTTVYATIGHYPNGAPGEIFLKASKQGSTLSGILDAFAICLSIGLQYGVPLDDYVAKLKGMRFEPAGITNDSQIRMAHSAMDWLARRLEIDYLNEDQPSGYEFTPSEDYLLTDNDFDADESIGIALLTSDYEAMLNPNGTAHDDLSNLEFSDLNDTGQLCSLCGGRMIRAGSCQACTACGTTSGCS